MFGEYDASWVTLLQGGFSGAKVVEVRKPGEDVSVVKLDRAKTVLKEAKLPPLREWQDMPFQLLVERMYQSTTKGESQER